MVTTVVAARPELATETCRRRLRALLGAAPLPPAVDWDISWHGPDEGTVEGPGSEVCIQALAGLMAVHGRDEGRPRRLGLEVASVAAGLLAAQGVLASMVAQARGVPPLAVHTSVLQGAMVILSHYLMVATALGDAVDGPPLEAPGPPFESRDGRWFEVETLNPECWKALWEDLGAGDADLGRAWTVFRWRYERAACSLPAGLHRAAARHTLAELEATCRRLGLSMVALRTHEEVLALPGLDADLPVLRALDPGPLASGAAPPGAAPGSAGGRRPLGTGEGPLAGIRVVEATSRIQGPFAGMLLRMLGADVVRIQPPEGDYGRSFLVLHREKATITLDLATAAGREELRARVAGADVFLHNWRPGKAEEWGLDGDTLAAGHPGLVYAYASGWGPHPGVAPRLGTDFLVQAYTGLGQGLHPMGTPAGPARMVLCDLFGALVTAEGVLAGLHRRAEAGGSWAVETSLLGGAMALQAHVLAAEAGGREEGRCRGRPLWGPLDHPLATVEGTLAVDVADGGLARLGAVCEVDPEAPGAPRLVAERLARRPAAAWAPRLREAGVPAEVVASDLATVVADPRLASLLEPAGDGGCVPRSPWRFG